VRAGQCYWQGLGFRRHSGADQRKGPKNAKPMGHPKPMGAVRSKKENRKRKVLSASGSLKKWNWGGGWAGGAGEGGGGANAAGHTPAQKPNRTQLPSQLVQVQLWVLSSAPSPPPPLRSPRRCTTTRLKATTARAPPGPSPGGWGLLRAVVLCGLTLQWGCACWCWCRFYRLAALNPSCVFF
jgi:hypothetical protein